MDSVECLFICSLFSKNVNGCSKLIVASQIHTSLRCLNVCIYSHITTEGARGFLFCTRSFTVLVLFIRTPASQFYLLNAEKVNVNIVYHVSLTQKSNKQNNPKSILHGKDIALNNIFLSNEMYFTETPAYL